LSLIDSNDNRTGLQAKHKKAEKTNIGPLHMCREFILKHSLDLLVTEKSQAPAVMSFAAVVI